MDCNNPFKLFVKTSRILRGEYLFFLLWVRTEDGRTSTPTPFCNIYTYREYVYIYMSIYIYIYIQGHIHSKTSHMIPAVKLNFSRLWLDFSALCRSIVNVVEKIIRAFSNIIIYSVNSTYKFVFIADHWILWVLLRNYFSVIFLSIQLRKKATLVYTPGIFRLPHPLPKDTTPNTFPLTANGPPLSPWHESRLPEWW